MIGGVILRIDRVKFVTALMHSDMTIMQLSAVSGVSRCTLSAIKSGKSCSKQTVERVAKALGLRPDDLKEVSA